LKEALPLMAQLPRIERNHYSHLLDIDPRIKEVNSSLVAYFRLLKKIVNPENNDLRVVYGCSGADCTSVLLATNAKELIFIDQTPLQKKDFISALSFILDDSSDKYGKLQASGHFIEFRNMFLGQQSGFNGEINLMPDYALKLLYDLKEIGVELNQVKFNFTDEYICLNFPWQYDVTTDQKQERTLTIYTADVTKPEQYSLSLKEKLHHGYDVFYMKGAFQAPFYYPQFLPYITAHLNTGGWLMTADKTVQMDEYNPEAYLADSEFQFNVKNFEEKIKMEEYIYPPLDPIVDVPTLKMNPGKKRPYRNSGTDTSYWTILNLRQKEHRPN
jgi:hypothetical protein